MNIQDCFPLGLTGLISLQSKGLSRVFSKPQLQSIKKYSKVLFQVPTTFSLDCVASVPLALLPPKSPDSCFQMTFPRQSCACLSVAFPQTWAEASRPGLWLPAAWFPTTFSVFSAANLSNLLFCPPSLSPPLCTPVSPLSAISSDLPCSFQGRSLFTQWTLERTCLRFLLTTPYLHPSHCKLFLAVCPNGYAYTSVTCINSSVSGFLTRRKLQKAVPGLAVLCSFHVHWTNILIDVSLHLLIHLPLQRNGRTCCSLHALQVILCLDSGIICLAWSSSYPPWAVPRWTALLTFLSLFLQL